MFRKKLIGLLLIMSCFAGASSCGKDDPNYEPSYTTITITPEKAVYHVGDVVVCKIVQTKAASTTLKKASYWWYASWWFNDPNKTADFKSIDENNTFTSSEITLTQAGEVKLYFFGRLEYPQFDFRKVEIAKTITVQE